MTYNCSSIRGFQSMIFEKPLKLLPNTVKTMHWILNFVNPLWEMDSNISKRFFQKCLKHLKICEISENFQKKHEYFSKKPGKSSTLCSKVVYVFRKHTTFFVKNHVRFRSELQYFRGKQKNH